MEKRPPVYLICSARSTFAPGLWKATCWITHVTPVHMPSIQSRTFAHTTSLLQHKVHVFLLLFVLSAQKFHRSEFLRPPNKLWKLLCKVDELYFVLKPSFLCFFWSHCSLQFCLIILECTLSTLMNIWSAPSIHSFLFLEMVLHLVFVAFGDVLSLSRFQFFCGAAVFSETWAPIGCEFFNLFLPIWRDFFWEI